MDSSGNATSPAPSAGLDPDEARRLLEGTEGVRRAARADAQGLAIPLIVLGPLTIVAAALQRFSLWWMVRDLAPGESRDSSSGGMTFSYAVDTHWGTAGALGLLTLGIWFAVRSRRVAPSAVIALALLVVSWRRHNGRLALWAVLFGVVTVLASFGFFSNRLHDLAGLVSLPIDVDLAVGGFGDALAQVALGVAMVVVGWRARQADAGLRRASASEPS